jgi:hypothetical protein
LSSSSPTNSCEQLIKCHGAGCSGGARSLGGVCAISGAYAAAECALLSSIYIACSQQQSHSSRSVAALRVSARLSPVACETTHVSDRDSINLRARRRRRHLTLLQPGIFSVQRIFRIFEESHIIIKRMFDVRLFVDETILLNAY